MVSCRILCLAVVVLLLGSAIFPAEVMAGGGLRHKKLLAAYLIAKAIKPRFVPIPLPLPFPIKLGKDSHVKYPVHSHSHSAHAQLVQDYGSFGGGHGGYGGGHGGYGGGQGGYGGGLGGYGGGHGGYGGEGW